MLLKSQNSKVMSWLFNIFELFLSPWIGIPNPYPEDPLNSDQDPKHWSLAISLHFLVSVDLFTFLDPDPDPEAKMNADQCGSESTAMARMFSTKLATGVVAPKLFIPDLDHALNFLTSGSRQKFLIHANPDQTYIN